MPEYSEEQLAQYLKTIFDIDVCKKDLVDCKPEFVQKIYTYFLKDFGASLDKLSQVPLNAPQSIQQHPEMFKSACFTMALAKTIQYYLKTIYKSNTDFQIKDLVHPNCARTKKFFSQLLEFYDHIFQTLDYFDAIENEVDEERKKFDKIKDSIVALREKRNKLQIENAEYEMCLQKEMELISIATKEMEKVQEMKNIMKENLEKVKEEINLVLKKTNDTELKILEIKDGIQILESQVVQKEEMVEIQERESKLSSLKASNAELKEQLAILHLNLENMHHGENLIVASMVSILRDIEQEHSKKKNLDNTSCEYDKLASCLVEKLEDFSRTQQQLIENIKVKQERQVVLRSSKATRKAGLLEEIEQLKINTEELVSSNEKHCKKEKDLDAQILSINETTLDMKTKLSAFLNIVESSYNEMLQTNCLDLATREAINVRSCEQRNLRV